MLENRTEEGRREGGRENKGGGEGKERCGKEEGRE